jgi:Icc-related predicted phosphoesterase
MKCVAISDLHNKINELDLPEADLLLIAGDLTGRGSIPELVAFNKDLFAIKDRYRLGILAIPGNHDRHAERDFNYTKNELLTNVKYFIHHESVVIEGIKFFGSGYSPEFGGWSFSVSRGKDAASKWSQIPDDTDILITHGPPYGLLDEADIFSGHLGCQDLSDRVLKVKPKAHVFGHIHGGYGIKEFNGTTFINAASLNDNYKPINPPIEFEI